jgi:HEAT repeat protein
LQIISKRESYWVIFIFVKPIGQDVGHEDCLACLRAISGYQLKVGGCDINMGISIRSFLGNQRVCHLEHGREDNGMAADKFSEIKSLLNSQDPDKIHKGLVMIRKELPTIGEKDAVSLFDMVSALFYIDILDHPEHAKVLDEAVSLVADFGEFVVPILLNNLDAGDMKAQLAIGHAFGRVGESALEPLLESYKCEESEECRIFLVYALGKIHSPKVLQAFEQVLDAAHSENLELRDTAVRALGNFIEEIAPKDLPAKYKEGMLEAIKLNLADPSPGVRSKAIRSYGKLARFGHLNKEEKEVCRQTCELLLGADDQYNWDRAYIVRKEAQEALNCLEGCGE